MSEFLSYGRETWSKSLIIVEDNVWNDMDAFILFSVKIGNDAVTLDRSGVTKDIPPYAIVVVNLAKIVKYTFWEELIEKILKIYIKEILTHKFVKNDENIYTPN